MKLNFNDKIINKDTVKTSRITYSINVTRGFYIFTLIYYVIL